MKPSSTRPSPRRKKWAPETDLPRSFRKPKTQPKSNQVSGILGSGYSGEQTTGALRALANNGIDEAKLRIARQACVYHKSTMGMDELLDVFHDIRRRSDVNGLGEGWKRNDIVAALSVALAEKRDGVQ